MRDELDDKVWRHTFPRTGRHPTVPPATAAEVQTLLDFYKQGRVDGSFEHGVEMALRAMLTSPAWSCVASAWR